MQNLIQLKYTLSLHISLLYAILLYYAAKILHEFN